MLYVDKSLKENLVTDPNELINNSTFSLNSKCFQKEIRFYH